MRHAGAIFLGRYTPEAMGDWYIAGAQPCAAHLAHGAVLPRVSRCWTSAKRTTLLGLDAKSIAALGPEALTLAESEGFNAHGPLHCGAAPIAKVDGAWISRLSAITLDEHSVVQRSRAIEQEREVAIYDLLESQSVQAVEGSSGGPYHLTLGVEETRLALDILLEDGTPYGKVLLSLAPLRKTIKDYFLGL